MLKGYRTLLILLTLLATLSNTYACTDFRLSALDGTVLITRTLEFAMDLKSNLMTSPRGRLFNNKTHSGAPALSWKATYGYVFLDALNTGVAIDGMNEQGLSLESLYLPGETQYQTIPAGSEKQALSYLHFGDWVLSNFKTIDEVKQALAGIVVFSEPLPQANNMVFPLHYAIYDSTGQSIIVEFIEGKMVIYDNVVGILTNSPRYDWHITNLRNYVNLSPLNPKPAVQNGITFAATGQGAGMLGLPGDISPPSRFVKMAVMLKTVFTPKNASETLNLAQHIINNVDIPLGFVREVSNNTATNESTQWTVFKDLTHKIFYYRTYGDLTLHAVSLAKLNFAQNAPQLKMSILSAPVIIDTTPQLLKSEVK